MGGILSCRGRFRSGGRLWIEPQDVDDEHQRRSAGNRPLTGIAVPLVRRHHDENLGSDGLTLESRGEARHDRGQIERDRIAVPARVEDLTRVPQQTRVVGANRLLAGDDLAVALLDRLDREFGRGRGIRDDDSGSPVRGADDGRKTVAVGELVSAIRLRKVDLPNVDDGDRGTALLEPDLRRGSRVDRICR